MGQLDHWNKNTLGFLTTHLAGAAREVRIATGFFTIQGYDLLRKAFEGKRVLILVGFDENSADRLKAKMIEDILAHLSRWDVQDRREAVLDLVRKIQAGELRIVERESIEVLDARIRRGDHAKLYILDDNVVLVGSSNLTVSGLRFNYEAVSGNNDVERVEQWITWFQSYWDAKDTYDLTQALLNALLGWLDLVDPFHIYLRTVLALVPQDQTTAPRSSYRMPVEYQQVVIERMLRQLRAYRGAFLVASTGLGKTVIATHIAYRLRLENKILNVMVFAPKQVRPDWEQVLSSAGISYEIFTSDLLDQPLSETSHAVQRMVTALENTDDKYLILIDESQRFRNKTNTTGERNRHSFERLVNIVERKNPYVVLLTATPFAKGIDDLNNQLFLLPHYAPRNTVRDDGQMAFDIMADDLFHTKAWRVVDTEQFFDDFMNLPVCTVISTSQVAKNFATHTDEGDFIDFGEQRKWLPQIEVRKVNVPLPLEEQISQALDQGYFKHRVMSFKTRTGFQRTESTVEQQVNVAWMSSPIELQKVIAESIADSFQVDFIYPQEERRAVLGEIQDQLKQFSYMDDQKLQVLVASLRTFITEKRKIIIFTERHSTAVYLEQAIGELVQEAHIANVVRQTDTGYELKDFDNEVFNLILDFAPEANRDKQLGRAKALHPFNVFITTDAYSAGINLQDASVVISYDIAWTPETIIQRAGRILRFWTKPRTVSLYIFVGSFVHDIERQNTSKRVEQRIRKLVQRTRQAEKFSELPMIPEGETAEYKSLGNLSHVTIENLGLVDLTQIEEFPGYSRFLTHITELHQHMELAKSLQNDIASALRYKGKDHLVYILLHYQNDYVWILYNVVTRQLIHLKEDNLLDLLYCHQDDIPASVDANIVEVEAQNAKNLWIRKNKIEHPEAVERICAMYLLPDSIEESIALRTAFN